MVLFLNYAKDKATLKESNFTCQESIFAFVENTTRLSVCRDFSDKSIKYLLPDSVNRDIILVI